MSHFDSTASNWGTGKAVVVSLLCLLSISLVAGLAAALLAHSELVVDCGSNDVSWSTRAIAVTLLCQVFSQLVLLVPLLSSSLARCCSKNRPSATAMQCSRAVLLCTSTMALVVAIMSGYTFVFANNKNDNICTTQWTRLAIWSGVLLFVSWIGLAISFWPESRDGIDLAGRGNIPTTGYISTRFEPVISPLPSPARTFRSSNGTPSRRMTDLSIPLLADDSVAPTPARASSQDRSSSIGSILSWFKSGKSDEYGEDEVNEDDNVDLHSASAHDNNDEEQNMVPSTPTRQVVAVVPAQTTSANSTRQLHENLRRLWEVVQAENGYLYAATILHMVQCLLWLILPHFVALTIYDIAMSKSQSNALKWLFLIGTLQAIMQFWAVLMYGLVKQKWLLRIRTTLWQQLLHQELAYFDVTLVDKLVKTAMNDMESWVSNKMQIRRVNTQSILYILFVSAYLTLYNPTFAVFILVAINIVTILDAVCFQRLSNYQSGREEKSFNDTKDFMHVTLANVRRVIAFAAERLELHRGRHELARLYQFASQHVYGQAIREMLVFRIGAGVGIVGTVLIVGSRQVNQDKIPWYVLVASIFYQHILTEQLFELSRVRNVPSTADYCKDIVEVLDRIPPAPATISTSVRAAALGDDDDDESMHYLTRHQYNVQFQNVCFAYPDKPDKFVLNDLTMKIPQGKTVALVGSSGSGKSTIVNLLQRLYDPNSGSILVDGVDIQQLDLWNHRRHVGVVEQNPTLCTGLSILDNVRYGCLCATRDEVVRACKIAQVHEYVNGLPQGYNTIIAATTDDGSGDTQSSNNGIILDAGQRQRIAIARAVVRNPSLLLLDEATAHLPNEAERAVQNALDKFLDSRKDVTTVVVAHRLRTVKLADLIIVLEKGRVVEQGTHVELLRIKTGRYRRLVGRAGKVGILPSQEHIMYCDSFGFMEK